MKLLFPTILMSMHALVVLGKNHNVDFDPIPVFDAIYDEDTAKLKEEVNEDNVNTLDEDGTSPVMMAILSGHFEGVEHLLSLGADLSIPQAQNYLPQDGVAFQGRYQIFRELLWDKGLDFNYMHKDGSRPMHRACWGTEQRHTDTVQALLEYGVPYDTKNHLGETCVDVIEKLEHPLDRNEGTLALMKEWELQQEFDEDEAKAEL